MPRVFWLAGEASGDRHGAGVMQALLAGREEWEFTGWGGPRMRALAGGEDFHDWVEQAAVVGLWEVLRHYRFFRAMMARATASVLRSPRPDVVVLVDYPGFNLRLARRLREAGYRGRIVYYISPQVWAWHAGRIPRMAEWLDLMLCIFPFEEELYCESGLEAAFVGHPLAAEIAGRPRPARDESLVALLPGSRRREVESLFPLMLEAADDLLGRHPHLRFVSAAASPRLAARMEAMAAAHGGKLPWSLAPGGAWEVMESAGCGVIASGTATLEAACFGLPYVLAYRVAWPTYWLGKRLIRVPHLGMANLLAGREVVRELVQGEATAGAIARELDRLLGDAILRREMARTFEDILDRLGGGDPYAEAAGRIANCLREPGGDASVQGTSQ